MSTDTKFIVVKIDPCPFCGDANCEVAESQVPNIHGGRKQAVFCHACFSEGPTADSQMDAIIAWNTRPTTQSAALLAALKGLLADVQNQKIETLAGEAWIYDLSDEDLHAQMGFADGEEKEEVKQRVEAILAARAAIAAAEPKAEGKDD